MYLLNAFSLNMIDFNVSAYVKFTDVSDAGELLKAAAKDCESAIDHAELAALLSEIWGFEVKANRATVKLKEGDKFLIAQYTGQRLPEGAKTLPEGSEIKFILGTVMGAK